MNATRQLHNLGQSLWLDNISRGILNDGTLKRYISELAITGLTSNPTIFQKAIKETGSYDDAILKKTEAGKSGEALFLELALEDLQQAADLFRPAHDATHGMDGWVSLEVSPLLADNADATIKAATQLHARGARPNLFIKIPGTPAGLKAIEESIFNGVPINVTLLFSSAQYVEAANAYLRGIERRIEKGLDPKVRSVASLFVSRWDVAVSGKVAPDLQNRLGIAVAQRTYKAYRDLLASPRWQKLLATGAWPQRLLWASTGTKDPKAADTLYIDALAAPDTINTLPEKTLLAYADHGKVQGVMATDGGTAEEVLGQFEHAGINEANLAEQLQKEGADAFSQSWRELLKCITAKSEALKSSNPAEANAGRS